MQVKHLIDGSSNFFPLIAFLNEYKLQVRPLTFFAVISATNHLQRQDIKTQPSKLENHFPKFPKGQKPSRFINQEIAPKQCERPTSCQEE